MGELIRFLDDIRDAVPDQGRVHLGFQISAGQDHPDIGHEPADLVEHLLAAHAGKTDIGEDYGAAVDSDGVWYLDGTDTTNVCFNVVDVDTDRNLYEVAFLSTTLSPVTGL